MNTLKILAKPSKFIFYLTLTIFFSKPIHAQNCRMGIAINDKNGGLNTLDIIEVNICKGSVYKFMAQPNHQNFQWYYNGQTLKDSTNESISVEKEGEYLLTALNSNTGCWSSSGKIIVKNFTNLPATILSYYGGKNDNGDYVSCNGAGFLSAYVPQDYIYKRPNFSVFKNGKFLFETQETFSISGLGNYQVIGKIGACQSSSNIVKVAQGDANKTYGDNFNTQGIIRKQGQTDKIEILGCTLPNLGFLPGILGKAPTWKKNGIDLNQSGIQLQDITPGLYTLNYEDYTGCTIADSVQVIRANKPKLILDSRDCYNYSLRIPENLLNSIGNAVVKWYNNGSLFVTGRTTLPILNYRAKYKAIIEFANCESIETEEFEYIPENSPISKFNIYDARNKDKKVFDICENTTLKVFHNQFADYNMDWYKDGKLFYSQENANNVPSYEYKYFVDITEPGLYYAKSNINGCISYSDTIKVNVSKKLPTQVNLNVVNCQNFISAPITEGVKYQWKKDGQLINNEISNQINIEKTGKYSLVSSYGDCLYESNTINYVKPRITEIEKKDFCIAETITLSGSEGESYQWTGPNNFKSTDQIIKFDSLTAQNQGRYTLEIKNGTCITKDSVGITVKPKAKVEVILPSTICEGVTTTGIIINSNLVTGNIETGSGGYGLFGKVQFFAFTPTNEKNKLYLNTRSNETCSSSITIPINFQSSNNCQSIKIDGLSVGTGFANTTICKTKDGTISFTTNSNDSNDVFYLKQMDEAGKLTVIDSSFTKSFPVLLTNQSQYVTKPLIIESKNHKIQSNYFNVNTYIPYIEFKYLNNTSVCDGYTIPIEFFSTSNYPAEKIVWKLDNKPIENANGYKILAEKSGKYTVSAEIDGCPIDENSTSQYITIGKILPPNVSGEVFQICNGGFIDVSSYHNSTDSSFKFQWLKNGVEIPNQTKLKISLRESGLYQIKAKQGNCSALSNTVKLVVADQLLKPVLNSYQTIFTNNFDHCNVVWATIRIAGPSTYYNPNFDFFWEKDGKPYENKSGYKFSFDTSESGIYQLIVKQNDCIAYSNKINIQNNTSKVVKLYSDFENTCQNDSIAIRYLLKENILTFFQNLSFHKYYNQKEVKTFLFRDGKIDREIEFFNEPYVKQSGKYHITVQYQLKNSDEICTISSDTISLKIEGNNITRKSISNKYSVCADSVLIMASKNSNKIGQWKLNNQLLPATNNSLLAKQSGIYTYTEFKNNGCTYEYDPITVNLNKIDLNLIQPNLNSIYCVNQQVQVYSNLSDYTNNALGKYEWVKDNKVLSNERSLFPSESGIYTLNYSVNSCKATASINLMFKDMPTTLTPNVDSLAICAGDFVNLVAPKASSYIWLNNGITMAETTQSIRASSGNKYRVWIEEDGCGAMSKSIKVKENTEKPTAKISGGGEVMPKDSSTIKIDFTSTPPWIFELVNDKSLRTAETTPYLFKVPNTKDITYELASVKNGCGVGTVSGQAKISIILADEELEKSQVSIFPNPSSGIVYIKGKNGSTAPIGYNLYSSDGKLLKNYISKKNIIEFNESIDMTNLPAGQYILKIMTDGKFVNYKVVKE